MHQLTVYFISPNAISDHLITWGTHGCSFVYAVETILEISFGEKVKQIVLLISRKGMSLVVPLVKFNACFLNVLIKIVITFKNNES